jgi:hypothetical protein
MYALEASITVSWSLYVVLLYGRWNQVTSHYLQSLSSGVLFVDIYIYIIHLQSKMNSKCCGNNFYIQDVQHFVKDEILRQALKFLFVRIEAIPIIRLIENSNFDKQPHHHLRVDCLENVGASKSYNPVESLRPVTGIALPYFTYGRSVCQAVSKAF